jgi:hypothetical protein
VRLQSAPRRHKHRNVNSGTYMRLSSPIECEQMSETHGRLVEKRGTVRIDADGKQSSQRLSLASSQLFRWLRSGDGVQVDDGIDEFRTGLLILKLHPLSQSSDIVTQVRDTRGLDARENDPW